MTGAPERYCYTGPEAGRLVAEALEPFIAVYDRRSGQTHLLTSPAPELLAELGPQPVDPATLASRLDQRFEIDAPQELEPLIAARLEELATLGLVRRQAC